LANKHLTNARKFFCLFDKKLSKWRQIHWWCGEVDLADAASPGRVCCATYSLLRHCRLLTGRRAVMPVAGALWRCAESGVAVMTDTIPSTSSAGDATAPTTRQILQRAIGLHRAGELESAAHIYREVLAQHPQQAIALHYLGIVLHQQGQHEAGLAYVRQSCALQPDNASWHNELGNMLFALGQFEAANEAYLEALQADPRDHEVWNNLGSSQLQSEATAADAVFSFEQALLLAPDFVPALLHLGNIHEAAGDKMSSARYQCRAFVLPPLEGKSKEMLGISFYFLGRLPEAAQMYRDWMQAEPDNPIAAHMYAAARLRPVHRNAFRSLRRNLQQQSARQSGLSRAGTDASGAGADCHCRGPI